MSLAWSGVPPDVASLVHLLIWASSVRGRLFSTGELLSRGRAIWGWLLWVVIFLASFGASHRLGASEEFLSSGMGREGLLRPTAPLEFSGVDLLGSRESGSLPKKGC